MTMEHPLHYPPVSFHPPIITPHNPPLSYFCGCPVYPPISPAQIVTSSYWPGSAGSAPHGLVCFEADPRHHYLTCSSSPCFSCESDETPRAELTEEDINRRTTVAGPTVRVRSPVKVRNKEEKALRMDAASLLVIDHVSFIFPTK